MSERERERAREREGGERERKRREREREREREKEKETECEREREENKEVQLPANQLIGLTTSGLQPGPFDSGRVNPELHLFVSSSARVNLGSP